MNAKPFAMIQYPFALSREEALRIVTETTREAIRFQEERITHAECFEEEIKMRESRIKQLQHYLQSARSFIRSDRWAGTLPFG